MVLYDPEMPFYQQHIWDNSVDHKSWKRSGWHGLDSERIRFRERTLFA